MAAAGTATLNVTIEDLARRSFAVKTNATTKFVVPAAVVRVPLVGDDGAPLANVKYALEVDGTKFDGRTSPAGLVEQKVAPGAKAGRLEVWLEGDKGPVTTFQLDLGGVPPPDTAEGVQARLNALGFGPVEVNGKPDEPTKRAIRAFQDHLQETPTGVLTNMQRERLVRLHDRG